MMSQEKIQLVADEIYAVLKRHGVDLMPLNIEVVERPRPNTVTLLLYDWDTERWYIAKSTSK